MRRLVVGADGSAGSIAALQWAGNIAAQHDAEVIVVAGSRPRSSKSHAPRRDGLDTSLTTQLDDWCRLAEIGSARARAVGVLDDPRSGILRVAQHEHAELVVVGRDASSPGPGLFHIGSMSEWLAHHSDVALAVVGGVVNTEIHRIVVGVDHSDEGLAAHSFAADLAAGVRPQIVPVVAASDLILEAATSERADVVVVGMRETGGLTHRRVGGVAMHVLHRVDRPVILVPPNYLRRPCAG